MLLLLLLDKNLYSFLLNWRIQRVQCQRQESETLRVKCENLQREECKG